MSSPACGSARWRIAMSDSRERCRNIIANLPAASAASRRAVSPVFDHWRENVSVIAVSNHGWKMIGVGHMIADGAMGEDQDSPEPFRFGRFATGEPHPVSHSPCRWS